MDQSPLAGTKRIRRSKRVRKSRATNPGHGGYMDSAAADAAEASIIELTLPQPLSPPLEHEPPPENFPQQSVGFDDSTNSNINWWSPLGQYVLRALSYAAMIGEAVPSAVDLYLSIEGRGEVSTKKEVSDHNHSWLATPTPLASTSIDDKAKEAWCEVCKIDCSMKSVLDEHLLGKRHKNNLLKLKSEDVITEPQGSDMVTALDKSIVAAEGNQENREVDICPKSLKSTVEDVSGSNHTFLASSPPLASASIDDRSTMGSVELPIVTAPPPLASSGCTPLWGSTDKPVTGPHETWCKVCKIDCTSMSELDKHLLGKRHKKNVLKLKSEGVDAVSTEPQGSHSFATSDKSTIAPEGNPGNQEVGVCPKSLKSTVDNGLFDSNCSLLTRSTPLPSASIDDRSTNGPLELSIGTDIVPPLFAGCTPLMGSTDKPVTGLHETWCEVCKIECCANSVLDDHLRGKRHKKNALKLKSEGIDPVITEPQGSHTFTTLEKSIMAREGNQENQEIDISLKSLKSSDDDLSDINHSLLDTSTPLPSASINDRSTNSPLEFPSATAPSPPVIAGCTTLPVSVDKAHKAWSEVCKIDCSTKSVLDDHLLGKRHKKNLLKLKSDGAAEPKGSHTFATSDKAIIAPSGNPENEEVRICPNSLKIAVDDLSDCNHSLLATSTQLPSASMDVRPTNSPLELPVVTALPSPAFDGYTPLPGSIDKTVAGPHEAWCEVCKIGCSKKSVLDEHVLGKRHKKNLLKLKSESLPPITTEPQGPMIAATSTTLPASTSASSDTSNILLGNPENHEVDGCLKSLKRAAADDDRTEDLDTKRRKVSACGA